MLTPGARRHRRRWPFVLAFLVLAGGAAAAFLILREPGNVSNPNAEFTAPVAPPKPKPPPRDTFRWPFYHFGSDRSAFLPASRRLAPPFRRTWTYRGSSLLEFPPVVDGPGLYVLNDNAGVLRIDKRTGRVRWKRKLGLLAAASPAVGGGAVYVVLLKGFRGDAGRALKLRQRDGKVLWARDLPSRAESSPLLTPNVMYFGSESGTVYALDRRSGLTLWTFKAQGAVKAGITRVGRRLFFGDYAGHVYCLDLRSGRKVWSAGTNGTAFGFGSGNFYSTAAAAYGRIYLGNTDGRVYSFTQRDGSLAWATGTGAYVYSSPAVATVRGLGPTVYIGSYDGNLYALNAQSGSVRWQHAAGGKISGGVSLVGNVAYFANLAAKSTVGLDARTGRGVFSFREGSFNPVISDGRTIYLTGYANLFGLRPR